MTITIQDMADNILRTLEKNGFPANSVALPLERLYESAHKSGLNFNKVLDLLSTLGITNSKTPEKIIFSKVQALANTTHSSEVESEPASPFSGFDFDALKKMDFGKLNLKDLNLGSMMSQASAMMKNMSPVQLAELKKKYDQMSPEERADLVSKVKSVIPK
jgi:hypothetical protein